jgi:hypothetical protein
VEIALRRRRQSGTSKILIFVTLAACNLIVFLMTIFKAVPALSYLGLRFPLSPRPSCRSLPEGRLKVVQDAVLGRLDRIE